MSDYERQKQILEILNAEQTVSVNKLVETLFVSPATIRRDLETMARKGLLKRTHGGAILFTSSSEESSIFVREEIMKKEKREICEKCIDYIKNNQSIFLDSSSTICTLVPMLSAFQYLTLITNGISAALLIGQKTNFKTYVPNGFIRHQSNSILGDSATANISSIYCDLFIFSCGGIDIKHGVTESTIEQIEIKKAMFKNSTKKILLVDSSKFGVTYIAKSCDIKDIDVIITDHRPSDEFMDYIATTNVELVICENN